MLSEIGGIEALNRQFSPSLAVGASAWHASTRRHGAVLLKLMNINGSDAG